MKHCGFSRTFEALHWEPWLFWRRCWELFSLIDGILTFRNCGFFSELDEFGVFLKLLCVEWISKLLLLTRRLPMGTLKLTGKGNCVNKTKQSQLLRENTHFVLNPDLRVQRLDNLVHEYFQVAKDCWHYWKNPNLANELSKPRIYTKYLSPKKQKWLRGQKKTENWKSITSAFSWLFFSFLPYRQRGNRRKLRKHLEKSRGNAMWWTKLQNSTKIHVMDWAIQNATRWWYPIMAVRKIKISQIFCNEKKNCNFLSKLREDTHWDKIPIFGQW